MKTKIIYISGNEIFDMADIRSAFEEVRAALNLDKETVLFGVPVDNDDAGLGTATTETESIEPIEPITEIEEAEEIITEPEEIIEPEITETPTKKRGRPRKTIIDETIEEDITPTEEIPQAKEEKVVSILSVLSPKETDEIGETIEDEEEVVESETEIDLDNITTDIEDAQETEAETEKDLEALLSEMKPLDEDFEDKKIIDDSEIIPEPIATPADTENVDATLQQLANEFAENEDKISAETKSGTRGKIGKLRNILPFKQSKHKDTSGLGDLFGWAGMAANDEDFSVPGFFTNAAAKK